MRKHMKEVNKLAIHRLLEAICVKSNRRGFEWVNP